MGFCSVQAALAMPIRAICAASWVVESVGPPRRLQAGDVLAADGGEEAVERHDVDDGPQGVAIVPVKAPLASASSMALRVASRTAASTSSTLLPLRSASACTPSGDAGR